MQYKLDEVTKNGTVYVHITNDEDDSFFEIKIGDKTYLCMYNAGSGGSFEVEIDCEGGDEGRFSISGDECGCELLRCAALNDDTMKGTRHALFDYAVDELAKL